jgi:protein TonB
MSSHVHPQLSPLPHAREGSVRRFAKPLLWIGAAVLLALIGWLVVKFLLIKAEPEIKHKVAQIQIVRPPPPPPPPPKPPEKMPEPPKLKQEVKIDPPKPADTPKPAATPEAPPPGPLGVDATGTGPGDGFGLQGRPGGRDVTLGGGNGGAGGGLTTTLFANGVARQIAQELGRSGSLRNVEYRVDLRVWIDRDGRIERHEIARSSGDAAVDKLITDGLARVSAVRQSLPENLKQPLRIRVTSADA